MKRLLAKSYDRKKSSEPPDYALLIVHSRDVSTACKALANLGGKIAISNAQISISKLEEFYITLVTNGWMQDTGKASQHFQEMVSGKPEITQLLRHETISGFLFLLVPELSEWIKTLPINPTIAIWGAMGHHRKFDKGTMEKNVEELIIKVEHPDFQTILQEMGSDLEIKQSPPIFSKPLIIGVNKNDICDLPARESLNKIKSQFKELEKKFSSEEDRRFIALIKAFGIAADMAASAIAKKYQSANKYSLQEFVRKTLSEGLKPEDLRKLIHQWAWKEWRKHNQFNTKFEQQNLRKLPPNFKLRKFQKQVGRAKTKLTLAIAGCGSGKSIAAYIWMLLWCKRFQQQGRTNFRVFFCLPTTGTTTEHFKDYALESGISEEQIGLTHSRSFVDLETMAETSDQEEVIKDNDENDPPRVAEAVLKAQRDKIESLALWSTPLVVTTADTILGLMANSRRGIYSIPAIMQSVIVFDEIHAFDEVLLGHLLVFLKNFPNLPVLLMTASLPEQYLQAIEKIRPDLALIPGDSRLEELERYTIDYPTTEEKVWQAVKECLAENGKVLWVRNQVEWANIIYHQAITHAENEPVFANTSINVYHSRLRYKDRSYRHRQVIDDFSKKGQSAFLIATQVAEMSLDLSADLLITDIAPIPSLIQRMGRLNRRATPEKPGNPKSALICALSNEKDVKPYESKDLKMAQQWLDALKLLNKPLSQKDLVKQFKLPNNEPEYNYAKAEERACFFSGLWQTRPGFTRGEGYTIPVILKKDLDVWKKDNPKKEKPDQEWLRRYEVSIPIRQEVLKWEKVSGIRIAPQEFIEYDYNENTKKGTGAKWL
ncbi:CRISPR-associated helicase Cas3 (plasmid) [Gloeothece citriformis PCC 7424]|uniref:CRISPR-associated helicase Cas3 n=1 Tax=Gloeothece citriformis (strain PCC 7424) TaxID=65393 RepID=B7KMS0_GLOC7|nr:CRISPR-associated helicase Cas3' [Gloeothece citriformis]ACK74092.1 CRISPR-associated helicase Cas3 [Gloeothece citriformis PCC 7424]